ncbi:MAG: YCF48-related protein [Chitinophagaceae bacterium]
MKNIFFILASLLLSGNTRAADYWQKVSVPSIKNLLSVSFGNKSVGYIAGTDSTLLKTNNGGKTWVSIKPTGMVFSVISPDITDVHFITDNIGYAIVGNAVNPVYNGVLYKTTDGGASWTAQNSDITCQAMFFFNENNGFVAGGKFFSGKNVNKLDAGVWQATQYFSFNPVEQLHAIDFYNANVGIVGGDSGYVYRTFNGGINWDTVKTIIDTSINDLKYIDENTILAATNNFGSSILISKDKGQTWNFDGSSATFFYPYFRAMARSAKDSFIFAGTSLTTGKGVIFYFEKKIMTIFQAEENLNHVTLAYDSTAFVVGDNGLILTNGVEGAGITEKEMPVGKIALYPNPTNGKCSISAAFEYTAIVYDCLGRKVFEDASYSTKHIIDLTGNASGAYFIEILTKDNKRTSLKLTLQ